MALAPPPGKPPRRGPDRDAALRQYRDRAALYDLELAAFEPIRRRAIDTLALRPGECVLDLGCGTGLSLSLLRAAVGDAGQVVGVEQSPEMLAQARARVRRAGWRNVVLHHAPVESAPLRGRADAALFHFTHDILRRADAVARVLGHLAPGARVVACGLKWAPAWALPANLLVLPAALHSVSSLEGLARPWELLQRQLGVPMQVHELWMGTVYIAHGVLPHPTGRADDA